MSPAPAPTTCHPLRFAFVSANKGGGGSEELWVQSAAVLRKLGHTARAFTGWPASSKMRLEQLRLAGITHVPLAVSSGWTRRILTRLAPGRFSHTGRLHRGLLAWRPDFVFFSSGTSLDGLDLLEVIYSSGLPHGVVTHLVSPDHWPDDSTAAQMIRLLSKARQFWAVSHHNLELLQTQLAFEIPGAKIARNPFLVRGAPLPWNAGADEDKPVRFAVPARLHPRTKGHDILVRVMAMPKWRNRAWTVSIYGTGGSEKRLQELVKLHGLQDCILFRGQTADIQALWASHDALLVPSRHEGLPLTVVEAMWLGRPVIAQPAGGIAEVVEDGRSGYMAQGIGESFFDEVLERAWQDRKNWPAVATAAATRIRQLVPESPETDFAEELICLAQSSGA